MMMLSWNVNGLRSIMKKGSLERLLGTGNYDVVLLQEIRGSGDLPLTIMNLGYEAYSLPAERKGYAGVMTLTKVHPVSVIKGLGIKEFDAEGRMITVEFNDLYIVNAYFPRAGDDLSRLNFKLSFCNAVEKFLNNLRYKKPIIICGDFNIARDKIDSSFWDEKHPGLTPEERDWLNQFLKEGFIDVFRELHPNTKVYTWRSYRERWRAMRIDYCIVSEELRSKVIKAEVLSNVEGSDHVPVMIELST
ncbi:exodeoxyribonuclease III [Vulcanisaeta souniana]|uniref:Exodeoxyribonuclease III n=2 Tax=Vulcanisaeta souniana TaxID=164452 RepID=A0A830E9P4_9CREN|nr:exodeoxyribonuclease III [Vulcanisaeta souniana]BDR91286.1 exodeoxyribonuclease III [Vulcanisaeta souniana JCM 11219]GGI84885.1 exodeoxyribonuclease III [Vulcanisaeta souniana JCM 11219]